MDSQSPFPGGNFTRAVMLSSSSPRAPHTHILPTSTLPSSHAPPSSSLTVAGSVLAPGQRERVLAEASRQVGRPGQGADKSGAGRVIVDQVGANGGWFGRHFSRHAIRWGGGISPQVCNQVGGRHYCTDMQSHLECISGEDSAGERKHL